MKINPLKNPLEVANRAARAWVESHEKITTGIPDKPQPPNLKTLSPGWNKHTGEAWIPCEVPEGTIVFDTETHGSHYQYPIIAVAVNTKNWYIWLSEWVTGGVFRGELVPLSDSSLVIAHNASFDRGLTLNAYTDSEPDWLDTQSMVQAVNGLNKVTSNVFKKLSKAPSWFYSGCEVSLKEAVTFWCRTIPGVKITQEDKDLRKFFAQCSPTEANREGLLSNWSTLLGYAINDVWCTYHLFAVLIREYVKVCPNLTSLYAITLMLRARLPINPDFADWVAYCESEFESRLDQVNQIISEVVRTTEDLGDPWTKHLDWSVIKSGADKGKIRWVRDYYKEGITLRSRILPYLLKLQWKGQPIQYDKENGWHYLDPDGKPVWLPHKLGEGNRVGNPLADIYRTYIQDGTLSSAIPGFDLPAFHTLYFETTYWYGNRDRIKSLYVRNNLHIPGVVPHRTVTLRSGDSLWLTVPDLKEGKIGTAIKSQIRVSDPYRLVGADFSTQEMCIAALLSDWWTSKEVGSNDFSLKIFERNPDIHTDLANRFGIDRGKVAKPLNFAGLYNCGANRYATVLRQFSKVSNPDELAKEILSSKRGERLPILNPQWVTVWALISTGNSYLREKGIRLSRERLPAHHWGGTDSFYYNAIEARLQGSPKTPLLGRSMPRWLEKANQVGEEWMTCANWVIQSTGVDILSLFLVLVEVLRKERNLNFTYVISRHDEVWYCCHTSEVDSLAEIMQTAHLAVWSQLASNLGLDGLPLSLALFPEINVDTVLRKEVSLDVWDGFGDKPQEGYYKKSDLWLDTDG